MRPVSGVRQLLVMHMSNGGSLLLTRVLYLSAIAPWIGEETAPLETPLTRRAAARRV